MSHDFKDCWLFLKCEHASQFIDSCSLQCHVALEHHLSHLALLRWFCNKFTLPSPMGLRFPSFSWHVNVWSLLLVCLAGCECFVTLTGCWGKSLKAQWYHSSFVHCMIQNGAHVMIKRWARIMIYSKLLIFIWTKNLLARWFAADSSLRFSLLWVSLVHLAISWGVSLQTIQSSGFSECEVWSIILM